MVVRRLIAAGLALLIASSVPLVQAQVTSNATCEAQYTWMMNSKGQTPCMASAYLSAQCNEGQWNVPEIGPDGPPPQWGRRKYLSVQHGCVQSFVSLFYMPRRKRWELVSAVSSFEQGRAITIASRVNWISNCAAGNVTIAHYPLPLPAGAAIPSWAYLDFTAQDMFQVNVAQQYATSSPPPESMSSPAQTQPLTSSAIASPTNTGTRSISNPGSTSSTPSTLSPTAASSSGGSSNTGPIVGGVVGGVLGLAVLGLIAWLLARKKAQQTQVAPSEKFGAGAQDNGYPVQQQPYNASQYAPVPPNQGGFNNQGHAGYPQSYAAPDTPGTGYKPYDPSDPSTFPATPANGAPTVYSQGQTEYSHPRPGQYNYAAEL
ncbi:hypothetical protein FRC10_009283 [Ceratobasidium sp. 414]|nr:hypothetical protein FRC10_009283 [Ceratobasidium sp. 414]